MLSPGSRERGYVLHAPSSSITFLDVVLGIFLQCCWLFSPSWWLQFASRISGLRFCEASAKDNFNVDEIFLKLVDDIISKVESEWEISD